MRTTAADGRHGRRSTARRRLAAGLGACILIAPPVLLPTAARADDPPAPREISVVITGDLIAHVSVNRRARENGNRVTYDYRPMFADIQDQIESADLAICYLEGPIAPPGKPYSGAPRFASPAPLAQSIKDVGFDRCSTASNHSNDMGPEGIKATLDAFESVGLGASGSGRTRSEATAQVFEVNGVKVAHLAYTFGFDRQRDLFRRSSAWLNVLNAEQVVADATDARARGAEIVIVSVHWGNEYLRVTKRQRLAAQIITASGQVDLIAGSHPHVLQPVAKVNGTWVLYSLGNFLSNQRLETVGRAATQDGVIARVTFTEGEGGRFVASAPVLTPTWVRPRTFEILDVAKHLDDPTLSFRTRRSLRWSWQRTTAVVGAYVTPLPPA